MSPSHSRSRMTRTLFSCGAGSTPRLKRVTSRYSVPSWTKVRTREVTSTWRPGTPHWAPTNSPPCAQAEPASNSMPTTPANTATRDFMVNSSLNHRIEGARKSQYEGPPTSGWRGWARSGLARLHLFNYCIGELRGSGLASDVVRQFFAMPVHALEGVADLRGGVVFA